MTDTYTMQATVPAHLLNLAARPHMHQTFSPSPFPTPSPYQQSPYHQSPYQHPPDPSYGVSPQASPAYLQSATPITPPSASPGGIALNQPVEAIGGLQPLGIVNLSSILCGTSSPPPGAPLRTPLTGSVVELKSFGSPPPVGFAPMQPSTRDAPGPDEFKRHVKVDIPDESMTSESAEDDDADADEDDEEDDDEGEEDEDEEEDAGTAPPPMKRHASAGSASSKGKGSPRHAASANGDAPVAMNANGKPKRVKGSSCHQCKTRRTNLDLCHCGMAHIKKPTGARARKRKKERLCRKKYCARCLDKFYGEEAPIPPEPGEPNTWACPGCRGLCTCAACKRGASKREAQEQAEQAQQAKLQARSGGTSSSSTVTNGASEKPTKALPVHSPVLVAKLHHPHQYSYPSIGGGAGSSSSASSSSAASSSGGSSSAGSSATSTPTLAAVNRRHVSPPESAASSAAGTPQRSRALPSRSRRSGAGARATVEQQHHHQETGSTAASTPVTLTPPTPRRARGGGMERAAHASHASTSGASSIAEDDHSEGRSEETDGRMESDQMAHGGDVSVDNGVSDDQLHADGDDDSLMAGLELERIDLPPDGSHLQLRLGEKGHRASPGGHLFSPTLQPGCLQPPSHLPHSAGVSPAMQYGSLFAQSLSPTHAGFGAWVSQPNSPLMMRRSPRGPNGNLANRRQSIGIGSGFDLPELM